MTPDQVKLIYIEAARTDRAMPRVAFGPKGAQGFWPKTLHTFEEMNGWGAERLKEEREEFWSGIRNRPDSRQIERWETCLAWANQFVSIDMDRMTLWMWALSKVGGGTFEAWCKAVIPAIGKARFSDTMGKRRLKRAVEQISTAVGNGAVPLGKNPSDGGSYETDVSCIEDGMMGTVAVEAAASWMADDAKPTDTIITAADAAAFARHLRRVNARRRRQQSEMIRRRKLGVDVA